MSQPTGWTAVRLKTAAAAVEFAGIPTPVPPGGRPETTNSARRAPRKRAGRAVGRARSCAGIADADRRRADGDVPAEPDGVCEVPLDINDHIDAADGIEDRNPARRTQRDDGEIGLRATAVDVDIRRSRSRRRIGGHEAVGRAVVYGGEVDDDRLGAGGHRLAAHRYVLVI